MLLKKYQTLVSHIIKFQKEFNNSNLINARLKLCEIFMFLCEEKKYLDTFIYQKLLDFKNCFLKRDAPHYGGHGLLQLIGILGMERLVAFVGLSLKAGLLQLYIDTSVLE